jgi:hypothetical protein
MALGEVARTRQARGRGSHSSKAAITLAVTASSKSAARDLRRASDADLDFIAAARQDIPRLIAEI